MFFTIFVSISLFELINEELILVEMDPFGLGDWQQVVHWGNPSVTGLKYANF